MAPRTDRVADGSILFGTCKTLTIDLEIRYKLFDRSHSFWADISLLFEHYILPNSEIKFFLFSTSRIGNT